MDGPKSANRAPDEQQRLKAVNLGPLPPRLKQILFPHPDFFPHLDDPKPGEWLFVRKESAQTFQQYKRLYKNLSRQIKHKNILLQPIGEMQSLDLTLLRDVARSYYSMDVDLLPTLPIQSVRDDCFQVLLEDRIYSIGLRISSKGHFTAEAAHIERLLRVRMAAHRASFMMALLPHGIHAADGTTLFGEADVDHFVGVVGVLPLLAYAIFAFSLSHGRQGQGQWPVVRVVLHELGHLFGMSHCVYYQCGMQGTKGIHEVTSQPLHLCPVCLRKLQHATKCDLLERYKCLEGVYSTYEDIFPKEKQWTQQLLASLDPQL